MGISEVYSKNDCKNKNRFCQDGVHKIFSTLYGLHNYVHSFPGFFKLVSFGLKTFSASGWYRLTEGEHLSVRYLPDQLLCHTRIEGFFVIPAQAGSG